MTSRGPNTPGAKRVTSRWRTWLPVLAVVVLLSSGLLWWRLNGGESPSGSFERGWKSLQNGDTQSAYRVSRALMRHAETAPYGELLSAAILARGGQFESALRSLAAPIEFEPTSVRALTLTAECQYRSGRWGAAVAAAQEAVRRDEHALDARRWLAAGAYDLGVVGLAAEELKTIAAADPLDGRPHRLLGLIEKDRSEYPEAAAYYRESLRRQPDPPDRDEVLEELAQVLLYLNQYQEALEVLEKSEVSSAVLVLRAQCFAGLGRENERREALEAARRLAPDDLSVLTASATLALIEGKIDQAVTWLKHAVAVHPSDSASRYQLGQALERAGRADEAREQFDAFKHWQKLEHEFTELHNSAAAEAENPGLRVRLAELALILGKPELAASWFKAALALDPANEAAQRGLRNLPGGVRNTIP